MAVPRPRRDDVIVPSPTVHALHADQRIVAEAVFAASRADEQADKRQRRGGRTAIVT